MVYYRYAGYPDVEEYLFTPKKRNNFPNGSQGR